MDAEEYRVLAQQIAERAGELVHRRRAEGVSVAATKSSPEDVVTAADRESEELVRAMIAEERPDDAILGEEGGGTPGTSGLTWVVDPIDGTVNYLFGLPDYAVSIAVVDGDPDPATWSVIAGAVCAPAHGVTYTAARGGGAHRQGTPIRASQASDPRLSLVGTGFGYDPQLRRRQLDVVAGLISEVRDIRRLGSAALDLCRVADGQLDAYFETGLNPWDMAAGSLIAREAGAVTGGLRGRSAQRVMTLASAPGIADFLQARLEGLCADGKL